MIMPCLLDQVQLYASMKERAKLTQDPEIRAQYASRSVRCPILCVQCSPAHETDQYSPPVSSMVIKLTCKGKI